MSVLDVNVSLLSGDPPEIASMRINEVSALDISYEQFFSDYLFGNQPCLLKNVSAEWICQKTWVKDGKPNFPLLEKKYGEADVPVSNCKERYFNAQHKCKMRMKDFLEYWQNYINSDYDTREDCFYLKDWHFANENPTEEVYMVPPFFASDWINEYLLSDSSKNDDYRFVYMGPKGSWTPLHADVFSSFSWSVNICGKKKWVFIPLGQEERLKDKLGHLVYDVDDDDVKDPAKFPHLVDQIVLVQDVGDAIFVPSGWHHQVWNLDDTISFNHNWVNGCNIIKMWMAMNDCLHSVSCEISDCKDMDGWDDQCQLLLKSCFGMDHSDFFRFLSNISNSRMDHLSNDTLLRVNGPWSMGVNHMLFDLTKIKHLLKEMLNANISSYNSINNDIIALICKIERFI